MSKNNRNRRYLFTSESVGAGHPDKVADQVSDAVLDSIIAADPKARVACETFVTTGLCVVGGEIIASEHGLGQQLSLLSSQFNTNGVLGILVLLALTGASINALMNLLENALLKWQ